MLLIFNACFRAVLEDDPFTRMKLVVKWYLSGFYKKPKGLKKPYNPCLGETFRCYWQHANGSRTFYIAEQVSLLDFRLQDLADYAFIDQSLFGRSPIIRQSLRST